MNFGACPDTEGMCLKEYFSSVPCVASCINSVVSWQDNDTAAILPISCLAPELCAYDVQGIVDNLTLFYLLWERFQQL
jgi:hypothetical protein